VDHCTECSISGEHKVSLDREIWPEEEFKKAEEKRLGTDLLTEFMQRASKSQCVDDFVCYCSSDLSKCYKYL
jgi:hypothetical protein